MEKKPDIYSRVTNKIIADLEQGNLTWRKPWNAEHLEGRITRPLRHSGQPYRGINIILLWAASVAEGYTANLWMTYRQAQELGGQVRKGSKGEQVVYADKITKAEPGQADDDTGAVQGNGERWFMKAYTVFNVEQVEGLPDHYYALPPAPPDIVGVDRIERLDAFVTGTGASIVHGGARACYVPRTDNVHMPCIDCFQDAEAYYATLAHELTHWTLHESRLDRRFDHKRFGDEGHAMEELVAELGAAFLAADLGITPETREDHAAYIASWLKALKGDKRAIFTAAAHAERATKFLHDLQPQTQEKAA
ncbi:MAG: ArdC family protein [Rhizobium rhizophilum]